MIIAKQINQEVVDNGYYELFTQETVKDIEDNEIVIEEDKLEEITK